MKTIKKTRCVACGTIMPFNYEIMGEHAAKCAPGKAWGGFESVDG